MMTDPIADLLTRIRNANRIVKEFADAPWSRLKENLVRVLRDEGYVRDFEVIEASGRKVLRTYLKYDEYRRPVVTGIRRVSRPSMRVYVKSTEIPVVRQGLGVSILSTPRGVLADRIARQERVGGEVLCSVW